MNTLSKTSQIVGKIELYQHQNFEGEKRTFNLSNYKEGELHNFNNLDINNKLSSIKWDLEADIYITLYENGDGTGKEYTRSGKSQDSNTHDNHFKDCASSFRWRKVDNSKGTFSLYADKDFEGKKLQRFLSEYQVNKIHPLNKTSLQDKMSSLSWNVPEDVTLYFYQNGDGTGKTYIVGNGKGNDSNTHNNEFKDCVSSWEYRRGLYADLDKPYDQNCYLCAHNAFANKNDGWVWCQQIQTLEKQLEKGVRAFMLDTYSHAGDVYLFHGGYEESIAQMGGKSGMKRFRKALTTFKTFLDEHPNDIITVILESKVTNPDKMKDEILAAGVGDYIYDISQNPVDENGKSSWPTLRWMIENGKRLVIFTSKPQDGFTKIWDYAVENDYKDIGKTYNRGESEPLSSSEETLFIMNHFKADSAAYGHTGTDIGAISELGNDIIKSIPGLEETLDGVETVAGWFGADVNTDLPDYRKVNNCNKIMGVVEDIAKKYPMGNEKGRIPNFLAVDFFHVGFSGGPRKALSKINAMWKKR